MERSVGTIRQFGTGATRDTEEGKPDYEGYFSPLVFERFGVYMTKHRVQSDGTLRASDNWKKGIPLDAYVKSLWRHFMDLWMAHRWWKPVELLEEALCAIIFNAQGYLHELLKKRNAGTSAAVLVAGQERPVRHFPRREQPQARRLSSAGERPAPSSSSGSTRS